MLGGGFGSKWRGGGRGGREEGGWEEAGGVGEGGTDGKLGTFWWGRGGMCQSKAGIHAISTEIH